MNHELQFDGLHWPPNMELAKLHLRCSRPGKDDINGAQCPCCHRTQKMTNSKWAWRNIIKDFKNYGGGIPAYFSMSLYFLLCLIILSVIIIIFHIYVLEKVCNIVKCPKFLFIFKFCHSAEIYQTLNSHSHQTLALVYMILLKISFIFLVLATLGLKVWLQYLNENKIITDDKIYSRFALMIKNIPGFYTLQELKKQLLRINEKLQICELFYVHQMDEFQKQYRKMFDKHYELKYQQDQYQKGLNPELTKKQIQEGYKNFKQLYQKVSQLKKNMTRTDGRAIVVFNTTEERNIVYKNLKISMCSKLNFYSMKLLGFNTKPIQFFADKISDPYQINWRYIGQNSVHKTKVQLQTTFIGVGFMVFCFALLYFPIVKIDEQKVKDPSLGSILGITISLILQILSIVYRQIIMRLIPNRKPSCKLAQSYFITTTTVVFHFFFYLLAPGTYYIVAERIPDNIKLKLLFANVVVFLVMVVIVCFIDLRYRLYNGKKKKLLNQPQFYDKFNQGRLHDQLNPPSFPIEFKIMVILNIWSFNAFYVFQIPYIMFLSAVVLFITYWNDKRILYNHYKMQSYLSIVLQMKVQKFYTVFFLIFTSLSFATTSIYNWEYYFVGGIFIIAMVINFALNFTFKKRKQQIQKSMTIKDMIKTATMNPKNSMMLNLKENQLKATFLIPSNVQDQTQSLGSLIFISGYSEVYERYLNQFRNKQINQIMEMRYKLVIQKIQKEVFDVNPQNNNHSDMVENRRNSQMKQLHNDSKLTLMNAQDSQRRNIHTKEYIIENSKKQDKNRKLSLEDKDADNEHLQNHSQGEKSSNSNSDEKQPQKDKKKQNSSQQKKQ